MTVEGVVWEPDSPWDETARQGSCIFTPVLPEGYALAEGVQLPEIYVMVGERPVLFGAPSGGDYHAGDVAVINRIITANGLNASRNAPEEWAASGIVAWSDDSTKRITKLNVLDQSLTETLDVSGLTELQFLDCETNQLTGLDVSGLTNLLRIDCQNNQLTELDVTGLTGLVSLLCHNNQLTGLDVSRLTNLQYLHCQNNQLTELDVSRRTNLIKLYCSNNQLTELNLSGLTVLQDLLCENNPLASLKLTNGDQLTVNSAEGGTVNVGYNLDSKSIELEATAAGGYLFGKWTATGVTLADNTVNPAKFTLNGAVTITPVFEITAEGADVQTARAVIENGVYTVDQTEAGTKDALKAVLAGQISARPGMSATGITVTPDNITVDAFTAATAGDRDDPDGTDGSFSFTVSLTKGMATDTAAGRNGVITATPYAPVACAISGTIRGSDTGSGIAAVLQLKNGSGENTGGPVTADTDGTYVISGVPAGSYSIDVSCAGYHSGVIGGVEVTDADVTGLDLTLVRMETHTVTADTGSGHGSSPEAEAVSRAPTTGVSTVATEDGGSVTTLTTASVDGRGKKTIVTTEVKKDAAGNVTGSMTTVTTENITTRTDQGTVCITVSPDPSAVGGAAQAAGASAQNPLHMFVEAPQQAVNGELQKPDVHAVQVDVVLPESVMDSPAIRTAGVTVGKETVEALGQSGKRLEITVRDAAGKAEAVWSLDGQAMGKAAGPSTDLMLGVHTAPVRDAGSVAEKVKSQVKSQLTAEGHENGLVLFLTAGGTLPSPAKLTVPATDGTGITAGSSVALYRLDKDTGALHAVPGGIYTVDSSGYVTIEIPAGTRTGEEETWALLPAPGTAAGPGDSNAHTIKAGDTLYRLSREYGCKVEDLLALNPGVDIYNLRIGSDLRVR